MRGAGCYGRPGCCRRAGGRPQGRGGCRTALFFPVPAALSHALRRPGGTMKSLKKESRLRIPTNRFLEASESVKGWRWLPWELRKALTGARVLGIHDTGPGGWG